MVDFDYEIENVVLSVSYGGVEFDLEDLSEKLEDARYDPSVFPGIAHSLPESKSSFLIFASGTANCVGAKSVQGARKAIRELTRRIKESGVEIGTEPEVEVQNIVASYDFERRFPLEKMARNYRNTEYEPEVFPGLVFRMEDPDVTLLIFVGGKGVGAGFEKEENIEKAGEKLLEITEEETL